MAKNHNALKAVPTLPEQNGRVIQKLAPASEPAYTPPARPIQIIDPHYPSGDDNPFHPAFRESAYAVAQAQLDTVADFMDLDDDLRLYLRTCQTRVNCSLSCQNGRWPHAHVHGLSCPSQYDQRPHQRWHPLSPRRIARRMSRPGDVDDLEMRADESALRRCQGRRHRRSEGA